MYRTGRCHGGSGAERSCDGRGFLVFEISTRGGGKLGNVLLVFHFSIRPRRRSCGNVEISPALGEISRGLVERVGSLPLAFHAFHSPGISTAHSGLASRPYAVGPLIRVHSIQPVRRLDKVIEAGARSWNRA